MLIIYVRVVEHFTGICEALREIAPPEVPFPQDIYMAKLTPKGVIIHPLSKHQIPMGHLDQQTLLLPFPLQCCALVLLAPAELDRIALAQHRAEQRGILDMLSALAMDPTASPAVRFCANGHAQVNTRIRSGDTKDLPATASKPDAVYNPYCLYSDPDEGGDIDSWPFGP